MVSMDRLLRHRLTKEAETDRLIPNDAGACPLLYPFFGMNVHIANVAHPAQPKCWGSSPTTTLRDRNQTPGRVEQAKRFHRPP